MESREKGIKGDGLDRVRHRPGKERFTCAPGQRATDERGKVTKGVGGARNMINMGRRNGNG
jgi:hypothetical protein